jgi:hypothetical protein
MAMAGLRNATMVEDDACEGKAWIERVIGYGG